MTAISHGEAAMFIAALPDCPAHHGPMHWDGEAQAFVCQGYDGEGCPQTLTSDQLGWRFIGTADDLEHGLP